ncbi:hypothetical protein CAPTEDRAFT_171239 [Capitella teleta]|uniref:BSD domain-containing protein n=1 Tax=Capitella teleta TaxID=283909 RepID=R7V6Q2_CAPTE|nr:hypothetical protein CAPTEDRAFT_171239 [Capitella teleta]|eukprot:ELU11445.1 hypothetical protein CAPTEDRAFT_171239 [Capitella teleta]
MTSMLNNMTSWFAGIPPDDDQEEKVLVKSDDDKEGSKETGVTGEDVKEGAASDPNIVPTQQIDFDEVAEKTLSAAKEWGSYLLTVGKAASSSAVTTVTKTAMQLKDTVEEKTIIGDFTKQQDAFVTEKQDKQKKSEAAVPPWVGYNEENAMKEQILALSSDKRNFLRNPPGGVHFNFDFEASFPVAMVMLQEDPHLKGMRFELVPKSLKEEIFWRNYFYRVSLIKQSAQLTSLAQQTVASSKKEDRNGFISGNLPIFDPFKIFPTQLRRLIREDEPDELVVGSPTEQEFISDDFQTDRLNEEELKKEMQQLGMSDNEKDEGEDLAEWEKELQAELQEYEVVNEGVDGDDEEEADLENEILQEIEAEAADKTS